jgi:hypothetical protein
MFKLNERAFNTDNLPPKTQFKCIQPSQGLNMLKDRRQTSSSPHLLLLLSEHRADVKFFTEDRSSSLCIYFMQFMQKE